MTLSNTPLKLTGPVLARIFLGRITKWDDPAITALNPGAGLPDVYISVVHRAGPTPRPLRPPSLPTPPPSPPLPPVTSPSVNQPGAGAYPICGYSWVLVSARQASQPAGQALVALLSWLTGPGRAYAASLGYVPLPSAVHQLAAATLGRVTGPAGTPLTGARGAGPLQSSGRWP